MKINYPTIEKESDLSEEEEERRTAKLYGHNNSLGFFPIGRLNAWHGGVHIEGIGQTIQAIADGRIIAYRIPSDYYPRDTESINVPTYSNGFVLMQHNYESPKEQKFRFYSLYMHLLPDMYMENKSIPDVFGKYTGKVTGSEVMEGLIARSGSKLEKDNKKGEIVTVISPGAVVILDPKSTEPEHIYYLPTLDSNGLFKTSSEIYEEERQKLQNEIDNHWSKTDSLKSFNYQRVKYKNYTDIYIATTPAYVKSLDNGKLQIACTNTPITEIDKKAIKGAVVYDKPDNTGKGKYIRTEAKGKDLGELEKVSDTWYKIKGKDEFLFAGALEITKTLKDNIKKDEVINDDIAIEAGTLLGYSGQYGFKNNNFYSVIHFEVFTDDNEINNFLSNDKGDDNRNRYEIAENKFLKVGTPVNNLKKGTRVKVYQRLDNYVQIGFEGIEGIIEYSCLKTQTSSGSFSHYTILPDYLRKISTELKCDFNEEDKFKFLDYVDENGNKISKSEEDKKIKAAEKKKETYVKRRKVSLMIERVGENFWVESEAVPEEDNLDLRPIKSKTVESIQIVDGKAVGVNYKKEKSNTQDNKPKVFKQYWTRITDDIGTIFNFLPNDVNTKDIKVVNKIHVHRITSRAIDNSGQKWCLINGFYFIDKSKKTVEGWIKEKELTIINPYNWNGCGWQLIEDTGNQYFYQFDANKNEKPHEFIKTIWKEVDLPEKQTQQDGTVIEVEGDKVLTQGELQRAMRAEDKVNFLSKLICKHNSEWDTWNNIDNFKQEVEALYKKGIDEEEDDEERRQLEEIRDERISLIEEKIQNLCFWNDVKDGNIATPVEGQESRKFPKGNSNVFHFHPIAFVEHMKVINGGLVYEIYHTGEIIQNGDLNKAEDVRFVYMDKNGHIHYLGIYKIIEIDAYENGIKEANMPKSFNPQDYTVRESSAYKENLYYKKLNTKIKTVNITEKMSIASGMYIYRYSKNGLTFSFYFDYKRPYAQPKCFASLLGAVIETGYKDIRIAGFTDKDGTGSPSLSHTKGINVDISNLDVDAENPTANVNIDNSNFSRDRTRNLANALIKFGYQAIRTTDSELCKSTNINDFDNTNKDKPCRYLSGHKDHLHCERYKY